MCVGYAGALRPGTLVGVGDDTVASDRTPTDEGTPRAAVMLVGEQARAVLGAFPNRAAIEEALLRAQCTLLRLDDPPIKDGLIVGRVFRFARWRLETLPDALAVVLTDPYHPTGFGFDLEIEDAPTPEVLARLRAALSEVHPSLAQAGFVLMAVS